MAFYKDACCHRLFVYVVVHCRDVAFHKNHPEMVGLHFIRVFCFVRTFNKRIHVVHAFHKPCSFMKCPRSHPPCILRGIKLVVLSKHHVDYWASCTNQPFYKHFVVFKKITWVPSSQGFIKWLSSQNTM